MQNEQNFNLVFTRGYYTVIEHFSTKKADKKNAGLTS